MAVTHSTMMIRQFDVVANPIADGRALRPYLICIQHNHLSHFDGRVLAPLAVKEIARAESRLNPRLLVRGVPLYLIPNDLLTLPVRLLKAPIANLEADRDRVIAALDLVFTGI